METIFERVNSGNIARGVRYRFLTKFTVHPKFPLKENEHTYQVYNEIDILDVVNDGNDKIILIEYKSGTDRGLRKWLNAKDFIEHEIIEDFTDYTCNHILNKEFICS